MTTPDPTPYLLPGDLRTAEDAAKWLREQITELDIDGKAHPRLAIAHVSISLDARLDRERRQACRRGCFAMFREACRERTRERRPPVQPPRYGGWSLASGVYREHRLHYLRRALAFRAAARQP